MPTVNYTNARARNPIPLVAPVAAFTTVAPRAEFGSDRRSWI